VQSLFYKQNVLFLFLFCKQDVLSLSSSYEQDVSSSSYKQDVSFLFYRQDVLSLSLSHAHNLDVRIVHEQRVFSSHYNNALSFYESNAFASC